MSRLTAPPSILKDYTQEKLAFASGLHKWKMRFKNKSQRLEFWVSVPAIIMF